MSDIDRLLDLRKQLVVMTAAKKTWLKELKRLADEIQYQTSYENKAYKDCIALIAEMKKI